MKNQAKTIQKINSLIANKCYQSAFEIMYRYEIGVIAIKKGFEIVEKTMSERTNGNFLHACAIFEEAVSCELSKIEKIRKSAKVREFTKQYKEWNSGYSMGELVQVVYKGNILTINETITDNRQSYTGRGTKWNANIRHGKAKLVVDFTKSRAIYSVEVTEK